MIQDRPTQALRRTVMVVAVLNLGYFAVEFATALKIDSVALLADSADFLEDAAVNLLIFAAVGFAAVWRARVGMGLAVLMALPALAFLLMLVQKARVPVPPEPLAMGVVGLGALVVNVTCAFLLVRHRKEAGSLTRAAFLSARNDALANVGLILAAVVTVPFPSIWPDIVVGLAIAYMNLDAAHEVWTAARTEVRDPVA